MSQGVLLSLLQQLGSDLASLPANVLPWIREAALALDPQVSLQLVTRNATMHNTPLAISWLTDHTRHMRLFTVSIVCVAGPHPGGAHARNPGRAVCSTADACGQGCRVRGSHPAPGHPCGQLPSHAVPLKCYMQAARREHACAVAGALGLWMCNVMQGGY